MDINVLVFGPIADITGAASLQVKDIADTDGLNLLLREKYLALKNMDYAIAVNKKIIRQNTKLKEGDTVALLPPFSGG